MKFFADENITRAIIVWLRGKGHDVLSASEAKPGTADADWLHEAEDAQRLILTADKDFGELVLRDRLNSHGVVLLRTEELTITERIARLESVWSVIEANPTGKFIVVTEKKIRVRSLAVDEQASGEDLASPLS